MRLGSDNHSAGSGSRLYNGAPSLSLSHTLQIYKAHEQREKEAKILMVVGVAIAIFSAGWMFSSFISECSSVGQNWKGEPIK
jgi:hypothetical protein